MLNYLKHIKNKIYAKFENFVFDIAGELIKDFGIGMLVNGMYAIWHGTLTFVEICVNIISMFVIAVGLKIKNIGDRK